MSIARPEGIAMSWVKTDNEGDGKGLLFPSPSGEGEAARGNPTFPCAVSFRSATEFTWGMKMDGRQTSRQNRRQALPNPAPS